MHPRSLTRAFAVHTPEEVWKWTKGPTKKSDISPHWVAVHACLKNEFTEDEKYHDLMACLASIALL